MSSVRVRTKYKMLHSLGAQRYRESENPRYADSFEQYKALRDLADNMKTHLSGYISALETLHSWSQLLVTDLVDLYRNEAGPCYNAAKCLQMLIAQANPGGVLANMVEALKLGIRQPLEEWLEQFADVQRYIDIFEDRRLKYDHYVRKNEKLGSKWASDREKNGKENKQLLEKMTRNTRKLRQAHEEYHSATATVCLEMDSLTGNKYEKYGPLFARTTEFFEAYYGHYAVFTQIMGPVLSAPRRSSYTSLLRYLSQSSQHPPKRRMEGYLTRRRRLFPTWSRCYMVLTSSTAEFYDKQEDARSKTKLRGRADLVSAASWDGKPNGIVFLTTDPPEHYAYADTREEQQLWLEAMQSAVSGGNTPDSSYRSGHIVGLSPSAATVTSSDGSATPKDKEAVKVESRRSGPLLRCCDYFRLADHVKAGSLQIDLQAVKKNSLSILDHLGHLIKDEDAESDPNNNENPSDTDSFHNDDESVSRKNSSHSVDSLRSLGHLQGRRGSSFDPSGSSSPDASAAQPGSEPMTSPEVSVSLIWNEIANVDAVDLMPWQRRQSGDLDSSSTYEVKLARNKENRGNFGLILHVVSTSVRVAHVDPHGYAASWGVAAGDAIMAVNGAEVHVRQLREVCQKISSLREGEPVLLSMVRFVNVAPITHYLLGSESMGRVDETKIHEESWNRARGVVKELASFAELHRTYCPEDISDRQKAAFVERSNSSMAIGQNKMRATPVASYSVALPHSLPPPQQQQQSGPLQPERQNKPRASQRKAVRFSLVSPTTLLRQTEDSVSLMKADEQESSDPIFIPSPSESKSKPASKIPEDPQEREELQSARRYSQLIEDNQSSQ